MVNHIETLPECREWHENMKTMFYAACGFFVFFLAITVPIIVTNITELRKDDAVTREDISEGFTEIKVQIASIQAALGIQERRVKDHDPALSR
jgi:hypothetical protein